ncbi:hypothetical protein HYX02_06540 [Candidatus Woesearchaeota archaeon]|nr:hypothetical protein [Candidatus Woesearchaeota archaeon]
MGIEKIKEEIIKHAEEESVALIAGARKEANRVLREAEKKIEEMREKSEAETKKMIEVLKRQETISAELTNKKMILDVKKQAVDEVFDEANRRLESLDDKKREQYAKKLLEKAKNDIEAEYFYCNKRDTKFFKGLNAEPVDIIGGLIAENKDKTIRVDYSFEVLLQNVKDKELQHISSILLG